MSAARIAVVGSGVLGAWAARSLQLRGARVTLVDAWGPAHSRASSGDETRIIRGAYGDQPHYVELTDRSFHLWEELGAGGRPLLERIGALWLFGEDDSFVTRARPHLERWRFPIEPLEAAAARKRFPQIRWDGVVSAYYESRAGLIHARRAVRELVARFVGAGGELRTARVQPRVDRRADRGGVRLADGSVLEADRWVFAAGPWLGELFPEWIGPWLRPTRQEVFYFGTPAGDACFTGAALPVWIDNARGSWYGIPGNEDRGFKISANDLGEVVDPTTVERTPDASRLQRARAHLGFRFPALANAPLLESRVCQYENTPDRDLLIDFSPEDPNTLVIGGGSGHAFKLGPALGELVARITLGEMPPPAIFQTGRFAAWPPDDPRLQAFAALQR
ncbi:MAG: FAD-dependent oxidoreductase [Opitutaceae bacterium]|nr:FAD-dependent oxidoreductase [Opitutaceae bacterium]